MTSLPAWSCMPSFSPLFVCPWVQSSRLLLALGFLRTSDYRVPPRCSPLPLGTVLCGPVACPPVAHCCSWACLLPGVGSRVPFGVCSHLCMRTACCVNGAWSQIWALRWSVDLDSLCWLSQVENVCSTFYVCLLCSLESLPEPPDLGLCICLSGAWDLVLTWCLQRPCTVSFSVLGLVPLHLSAVTSAPHSQPPWSSWLDITGALAWLLLSVSWFYFLESPSALSSSTFF